MRNTVGALAVVLAAVLILPGFTLADEGMNLKKYGIEFQLGGSYMTMDDVNDFIPEPGFITYYGGDKKQIHFGTQFGIGFVYRHMKDFGWMFGYNRFMAGVPSVWGDKYRRNAYFQPGLESWTEQTITGSELYIQATWFWPWKEREIMFAAGPAVYSASLDRTISIIRSVGSGANPAGSFSDASGIAVGLLVTGGVEFPMKGNYYLTVQGGFRLANVGTLTYDDNQDVEQTVYKNTASNATFGVDFSGAFVKFTVRTFFKPSSKWRSHK